MELSEQQTLCINLKKQIEELQMELRSVRTLKKQQARIQFLLRCHVVFGESNSMKFFSPEIIEVYRISYRNGMGFLPLGHILKC